MQSNRSLNGFDVCVCVCVYQSVYMRMHVWISCFFNHPCWSSASASWSEIDGVLIKVSDDAHHDGGKTHSFMYRWHASFMHHVKQVASMHSFSGFKTLAACLSLCPLLSRQQITLLSLGLFEWENPPIKW